MRNSTFDRSRSFSRSALLVMVGTASVGAIAGCSTEVGDSAEAEVGVAKSALSVPPDALTKTLNPLRQRETPGSVYLKTIRETFPGTGTFAHTFHVYQPDSNGEAISFELGATTSTGTVDMSHQFQSVSLISRPGQNDQNQQTLPNSNGQKVYTVATSRAGWYQISFQYVAPNANRTLTFRATDAAGNALKTVWGDPPGTNVQIRLTVRAEQVSQAFLKGGAFKSTNNSDYTYLDNIKVDGSLLYRRGFDQGQFNYPLGRLSATDHTVEFSFNTSGTNPSYLWFGVNEQSFDRVSNKSEWSKAQFIYRGAMHTADYDAWNEGVAFAQGPSLVPGVRPPPVRRGTAFALALEDSSLNGASNATVRVYPYGSSTPTNWSAAPSASGDYTGGIWTSTGFSTRYRENWTVQVPVDAPVGRYVVRAFAPSGAQIGQNVLFYVVHNPYTLLANGSLTKQEIETYAYDEDEDGVTLNGNYGPDQDASRDNFTAIYLQIDSEITLTTKVTGAFRRTQDTTSYSMLDNAMAAADGTASEFDSMRRLYRVVAQRLKYNHYDTQDDSSATFLGNSIENIIAASKPGTRLPLTYSGQCQDYSSILAALARASGIVARVVSDTSGLGGWGLHYFTETYIPDLPHHGGKTSSNSTTDSDIDHWYVFDSTDPSNFQEVGWWSAYGEAIAPRAQYGLARRVTSGPPAVGGTTLTTRLDWNPWATGTLTAADMMSVSDAYQTPREYWLTASGTTGWIGFGEKDVFRVNKATTGAAAVRVRSLSTDGAQLTPMLCVVPITATQPLLPERCADYAETVNLPAGDSYVVVFNSRVNPIAYDPDTNDPYFDRILRGDTTQYVLDLDYGNAPCSESTSIDLGTPGTNVSTINNGCLKITQYPNWWGTRGMQLQNTTPGSYPVPFDVYNCGGLKGSGIMTADWQSFTFSNISQSCTTFVKLKGDGRGNVTLHYYGL